MYESVSVGEHRAKVYRDILARLMSRFTAEELSQYHQAVAGLSPTVGRGLAERSLGRWLDLMADGLRVYVVASQQLTQKAEVSE